MGENKTPHFYDFWIFEPVTKPHNQLFLSLETPRHQKEIKESPGNILKQTIFINLKNPETRNMSNFEKTGARKKRRSAESNLGNLGYGINIFLKT